MVRIGIYVILCRQRVDSRRDGSEGFRVYGRIRCQSNEWMSIRITICLLRVIYACLCTWNRRSTPHTRPCVRWRCSSKAFIQQKRRMMQFEGRVALVSICSDTPPHVSFTTIQANSHQIFIEFPKSEPTPIRNEFRFETSILFLYPIPSFRDQMWLEVQKSRFLSWFPLILTWVQQTPMFRCLFSFRFTGFVFQRVFFGIHRWSLANAEPGVASALAIVNSTGHTYV